MKKLLFIVAVVLCLPVSHLFADEWREVNADTEFLPETILVFPFGEMFDYVYVIGTTQDGAKVACQIAAKPLKSDNSAAFLMGNSVFVDEAECSTVAALEAALHPSAYRLYIERFRDISADAKKNALLKKLTGLGVQYVHSDFNKKKCKTITSVQPVSADRIPVIVEN